MKQAEDDGKKGRRPKPMTGFMRIGGIAISGRTSSALFMVK